MLISELCFLLSECVRERSLAVDVKVCAVSVRMWMIQGLNDAFLWTSKAIILTVLELE